MSSRYTSIKTRIETFVFRISDPCDANPLATLPSKQGLKPDLQHAHVLAAHDLSLHFHQNKD